MPRPRLRRRARDHQPTLQATYAPGARVEVRGEEWMVRRAEPTSTSHTAVHVTGLSELVRNKTAIFLTDLDEVRVLKPEDTAFVADPSPQYRRTKLYLESLLRQSPPTDDRLYVGHRGAMNAAPYQLVPAAKALSQPRPRILIADAVGLGKTVEVGILLSELIRRGRGRRILVVALKSVLEQFQQELWARFTIPLVRLDSVGLQRVQRKIPANHNPFYYFDRAIISIDTLKKDEKYRRFLEACHWDAIVIDECQHVALRARTASGRGSQRSRLAQLLARTSDALILTSATPHDGKPESFASLMNLLEPTAVADPSNYSKEDVQGLYVRRFKKDVADEVRDSFRERKLELHRIDAAPEENAVFAALAKAEFRTIHQQRGNRGILFRTLLLKAFLSSPEALRSTLQERLKHPHLKTPRDEDAAAHDRDQIEQLEKLAKQVPPKQNSKLERLLALLEQMKVADAKEDNRVVVFSERIHTLGMLETELRARLKLGANQVAVFHGTLDDQRQQQLVKDFGSESSKVRVLLASDAASEGINLHHYCHRMVHYDIPWSLITLEQRNGRIDRYGQQHEPEIHYLLSVPDDPNLRGDLRVLDLLIEKEAAAHKNLGDVRWLMGLHDAEAEAERVAEGIARHESPEQILPEEPAELDFFQALLAASQADDEAPPTAEPLRLYPDDLSYLREAFAELVAAQGELVPDEQRISLPSWQDHLSGAVVQAPEDLRRRYRYLPPELQDGGWEFKLSANRTVVQHALAVARKDPGRFPEWQLLWEQHPILEWLNDRLVAHFRRHEAPVLKVQRGLDPGESAFIFQGVMSNRRSQPLVVDWFGVRFAKDAAAVVPFPELAAATGLDQALVNDGRAIDFEPFAPLRGRAVALAAEHMRALRQVRAERLRPELEAAHARIKSWHALSLSRLDEQEQRATQAGRTLRADVKKRLEQRRHELTELMRSRQTWLTDSMTTSDQPYLRLAVVLTRPEAR